ncbi:MAG: flagellar filament capping protein FliD [Lachnospiraceae bacterium]|nr:flagellar filament capping protein FliD [Lachnospiraceae bacterium]
MGIGLSGMISGLDTDSIVNAMVGGQTAKKTKVDNKITLNKWTTSAWSDLNKKIYSFYTDFASKLRLKSAYQTKTAESSDDTKIKATATSSAAVGQHTVKIKDVASSQYVTGAKLSGTYTQETRIAQLDAENPSGANLVGQTITFTTKAGTADEKKTTITVDQNTKIKDVIAAAKEAGLSASYDTNQKRFFFSSADSGTDNKFTITSTAVTSEYANAKSDVVNALDAGEVETLSDVDKDIYNNAVSTILSADKDDIAAAIEKFTDPGKSLSDEQALIYDAIINIRDLKVTGAGLTSPDNDAEIAAVESELLTKVETFKNSIDNRDQAGDLTKMGLGTGITGENIDEAGTGSLVVRKANDAQVIIDGATMTSSTNSITANGLTINLLNTSVNEATGEYDEVTVTVGKDTTSTYELVKNAVKEYNNLIEEMGKLYYADSARGYDPLTAEQKESMTDEEVEQWENKIKSSLLRRDSTLGGLMSAMRSALQSTYKDEEGNEYSLTTYGIVTGNYTERGKLHIYGNTDDPVYASNTDRLQAALNEDPDKVMNALSGIFTNLYTTLSDKCGKTSISSALTFYNDKQYAKDLDRYQKDLEKVNSRIDDLKDKYYKQFTAMEKALATLQSQSSSLAQMLGQTVTK